MDALREQLNKPLVMGIAGFVVGLFIGLVILGWWLLPVQWTDAGPEHLRAEYQEIYLRLAIDSYTLDPDPVAAQQRVKEIGEAAPQLLADILANPGSQDVDAINVFVALSGGEPVVKVTAQPTPPGGEAGSALTTVLVIFCVVMVLLVGGVAAVILLRERIKTLLAPREPREREEEPSEEEYEEIVTPRDEPPMAQFMTTYTFGNDLYDDSFSIDSQSGEFLGESGVGISETVGVGEPKRVTAFEVWLFDKNDIQTVTKVLMSSHAFKDEDTRQRLEAKGEPVLAETGKEMLLETATLRLVARVVDMSYGSGAAPQEAYFDRLTLELAIWSNA